MITRFSAWPVLVMLALASLWAWLVLFAADPASLRSRATETKQGVEQVAPDDDVRAVAVAAAPTAPRALDGAVAGPAAVAPSLRGTDIDGAMHVDAQGRLTEDRALRRLFDYLLAGASETPIEALRARLEGLAIEQGGDLLAAQGLSAFDRYLAYLRAESALNGAGHADRREQLTKLMDLRRRILGAAAADAYFGEEERYALALLDDSVPMDPQQAAWQAQATEHQRALEQSAQFDRLDIDASQRWSEREALYGAEAADRLAQLDAEQQAWDARLDRFREQRAQVLANSSLDAAAQAQAIDQLLQQHFSEPERRRVQALMEVEPSMP